MINSDFDINRVYKFCKLLNIDIIKFEVNEYIKGSKIKDISLKNDQYIVYFINEKSQITLILTSNNIKILKNENNNHSLINIDEQLLLDERSIEKRPKGIIYSKLSKQFGISKRFNNEVVLTDLEERRYAFNESNIKTFKGNIKELFSVLNNKNNSVLNLESNYSSIFSTHMISSYYTGTERVILSSL